MTLSLGKVAIEPVRHVKILDAAVVTDACNFQNHDAVVIVDSARVQKDVYDGRWGKLCLDNPEGVERPTPIQSRL